MLKIYIYGYLNRIRSSRKLEAECSRNIELIWLTGRLAPDFKTIADFRKDNRAGIKKLFREFLNVCQKLELLSFDCIGIDGTKKRAKNHLDNIYHRETIDKIRKRIQERIDNYLEEIELNDKSEEQEYQFLSKNLTKRIKELRKSKDKIDLIKGIFEQNPDIDSYFANDPDSRYQNDNKRINAGYNCQIAVDEKNKLLVANDITNESNDLHQLNTMKDKVSGLKKDLGIDKKSVVVADAGYFEEKEIVHAEQDESYEIYVSHPRDSQKCKTKKKDKKNKIPCKGFNKDDFTYNKEDDCFVCPEGKLLTREGNGYIDKRTGTRKYKYTCQDCAGCSKRKLCTSSKDGRSLKNTEFFNEITEFRKKCNTSIGKQILSKRKEIVEHPFGTMKHNWGYRYFMQVGKENVSAEFSFIGFVYNLRRVLNIIRFDKLMDVLETI